ncbi:MAG: acyl-CoA dehydrogenase family protein, partial [Myxococcota bacterium]
RHPPRLLQQQDHIVELHRQAAVDDAQALWSMLAELGLPGMLAPEVYGGLAMQLDDVILLLEETGRVALPAPLVETAIVAAPLLAALPEPLASRWLPGLASGEQVAAASLDPVSPLVADAHRADVVIMVVGSQVHAVPRNQLTLKPEQSVDRSRRLWRVAWSPTAETRLAAGPFGAQLIHEAFNRGAVAVAAQLVGLSRQMLAMTVSYVGERKQFGRAVGSFQAVKHHLASALVRLEFAVPVVHRAAYTLSHPEVAAEARQVDAYVSHAFIDAAEAARTVGKAALQCHGAIGYSYEYDLHLWMKRVWALTAAWGTLEMHYNRVAAHVVRTTTTSHT